MDSDAEDEDQPEQHVHVVTSNPPDQFEDERSFNHWLHSHPLHEGEHNWRGAQMMGFGATHQPQDEDEDEQDSEPVDHGQESQVSAGVVDEKPVDYSYLHGWKSPSHQQDTK
jgi:hypothetical protein